MRKPAKWEMAMTSIAAIAALSLLVAGCSNSSNPERSAAAADNVQSAPSGDEEPREDSVSIEVQPTDMPEPVEDVATTSDEPKSDDVASSTPETTKKNFGSKLCIVNNSTEEVVISAGLGQGSERALAPGIEQCGDNFNAFYSRDLGGVVSIGGNALMSVTMNNPFVGVARVVMYQAGNVVCPVNDIAGPGVLGGARDDGVLRYQLMRVTPYSLKPQQIEYQLVLSDSNNPTSSGRPVACR